MNVYMPPNEGDIYKVIEIDGRTFELRFGYYEEFERARGEPVVIYPNLRNSPVHTKDGHSIVTVIQEPCEYYRIKDGCVPDESCGDCIYYQDGSKEIGICLCEERRAEPTGGNEI